MKKKIKKLKKKLRYVNDLIYNKYSDNIYIKILKNIIINKIKMKKNIINKKSKKKENIYFEIRSGIGGKESSMFVKEILCMYKKFFERQKFFYETFFVKNCPNGIKRVILRLNGYNIFKIFIYENGVHRVQRIPKNDKKNRTHTSTCIVEVYREIDKKEISINRKDIIIETYKSSGSGGQHVNKTNSAVRIIHKLTGIKVECQKERSQIENKKFALKLLVAKLKNEEEKRDSKSKNEKRNKNNINYSTRSTKIRTFNFIQNRITDHIIKKNFYFLEEIFYDGKLEKILKKNKLIKDL